MISRFRIRLLGWTVVELDVTHEIPDVEAEAVPEELACNHAGDFGFGPGTAPAHPYWTSDPTERPAVAREAP